MQLPLLLTLLAVTDDFVTTLLMAFPEHFELSGHVNLNKELPVIFETVPIPFNSIVEEKIQNTVFQPSLFDM